MAATGSNAGSRIFGVGAETSIAMESSEIEASDPGEVMIPNESGADIGFWYDVNPQITFTVNGETNGTTGVIAATFGTAVTVAAMEDIAGVSAGGNYVKTLGLSRTRTGMKTVAADGVRKPGIT